MSQSGPHPAAAQAPPVRVAALTPELIAAQQAFADDVALLILWLRGQGIRVTWGETYRPPELVKLYAEQGRGSRASVHPLALAVDLRFWRGLTYLTDSADYAAAGRFWKALRPGNTWGGDFDERPDGNHFSHAWGGRA